ncbi:amidohydrolase family protein [Enterococcus asini]|uniref:amidohydrolase family protein n=1 Tax=Enterococcus asini TaxID=57732 RepID=UPI0032C0B492
MKKLIRTNYLFDGENPPRKGYVTIEDKQITRVAFDWAYEELTDFEVIDYSEQFVMPGLHDNHVFFSGYLRMNAGIDLSHCRNVEEALVVLRSKIAQATDLTKPIYAHGFDLTVWPTPPTQAQLDALQYPGTIAAIDKNRSFAWLNQNAKKHYGFTEEQTSAEAAVRLIKELLADEDELAQGYQAFEELLLSRGVVSLKEIVFDEASYFEHCPQRKLATTFYVQAVAEAMNIERLMGYQKQDFPKNICFGGAKIMVDGVVADETGETNAPYTSGQARPEIDYQAINSVVQQCNEQGIPCCLTTEGDLAGEKAAELLKHFGKRLPGGVYNSISDLEMITAKMAKWMAEGDIVAEIYPQILGLNPSYEDSYMLSVLPAEEQVHFFDYRMLADQGVCITSGTDLPLFITSLPESILFGILRKYPEKDQRWNPERGLDFLTLFQSYTKNAYRANGQKDGGVIKVGATANLAIFDRNIWTEDVAELAKAEVLETYIAGEVVYRRDS